MHHFTLFGVCVLNVMFLVAVLVPLAECQDRPTESSERVCYHSNNNTPAPGGLCGDILVNSVRLACRLPRGKRSNLPLSKVRTADTLTLQKRDAMRFLVKKDIFSNIVCECCYNRCSIRELQEYCD
ncbi:insulin-related peptide [Elysia marginata]|uniref:Insulin-related peptide n=1 Tax=Elysia marginata TaxID=1093978 RepID=A0AAV4JDF7_9GAST|nr:insulin-related peptide [Elysia marginata]